ncbi:hypothetical protein [Pseudorhodobacter ferrugineus]|uniref:hypothetical protein n=1 Tax=Pseudorhodobacter ferrugineus TaxID=77008 RepID=UPI0003B30D92|nr:hypothetical protein [Pseudorhodobacter ferrugineus]
MQPDLFQSMLEAIAAAYEAEADPQGPPIASATVIRVKLKLPETERKRQDRFVRRAKKRVCPTKLTQHRGPIHPHWSVPASANEARREKHLIRRQDQANLPSNGRPLGACRFKRAQRQAMGN